MVAPSANTPPWGYPGSTILQLGRSQGHPSGEAKEVRVDIMTCAHQEPWRHEAAQLAKPLSHGATRDVSDGKHPIHPCGVLCCAEMLSLLARKEK